MPAVRYRYFLETKIFQEFVWPGDKLQESISPTHSRLSWLNYWHFRPKVQSFEASTELIKYLACSRYCLCFVLGDIKRPMCYHVLPCVTLIDTEWPQDKLHEKQSERLSQTATSKVANGHHNVGYVLLIHKYGIIKVCTWLMRWAWDVLSTILRFYETRHW